jgi:hypothetical protein
MTKRIPPRVKIRQRLFNNRISGTYDVVVITHEGDTRIIAWTTDREAAHGVARFRNAELGIREKRPDLMARKAVLK